jgi:hypothetical protein
MEEVDEAWTWRRRSVVPIAVLRRGGEGQMDGAIPGRFDVEEERGASVEEERGAGVEAERGTGVEAHTEDTEEGARWRWTQRRSRRRWVCGGEMKGLGFRGKGTLKKKNSSDGLDDVINARRYCGYSRRYRFLKNMV